MSEVVVERRGVALVVRINRPEARNAMSNAVRSGIGDALLAADADPDVGAVVLTGTGDRAFCAGMDLREVAAGAVGDGPSAEGSAKFGRFIRDGDCRVPVIAAVNASAVAGGFELVLACDLAVAAEGALVGLPEVKRGLFAAGGGVFLSRRIPLAKAMEITLTGDLLTVEDAAALGLINKVVPADRVLDEALALAERIAVNGPLSVAATKELVRLAAQGSPGEVWPRHDEWYRRILGSEDAREGAAAFVERRPPVWRGR